MGKKDNYVAYIPVRGGSKSIPLKNIKMLNGKPLVHWTIEAAVDCPAIDKVYVGTDSPAIREKVEEYKQNHPECRERLFSIDRAPHTVTDTASTESAMLDFAGKYDFEHIILVQATSPMLRSQHLAEAIVRFEQEQDDSLLSVVGQKRFIWERTSEGGKPVNYDYKNRPRRQEFNGYMVENGAFYITSKERLLETGCRLSGKIGLYEMEEETYFEIDEPSDWVIIEHLMKKKTVPQVDTSHIKLLAMDCDGCLTDGGMYYSENMGEIKKFSTLDGMGLSFLREAGIKTAIITGENTEIVANRVKKLKINYLRMGVRDKLSILKEMIEEMGITLKEVAYIGDDVNDVDVLRNVGLSFSVPNGVREAREAAQLVVSKQGGSGAVREVCEFIMANRKDGKAGFTS